MICERQGDVGPTGAALCAPQHGLHSDEAKDIRIPGGFTDGLEPEVVVRARNTIEVKTLVRITEADVMIRHRNQFTGGDRTAWWINRGIAMRRRLDFVRGSRDLIAYEDGIGTTR